MRIKLYGNVKSEVKFKSRVGDRVRISKSRRTFKRGYSPWWTEEISTISKRIAKEHPIYKLTDDSGGILEGSFYQEELQEVLKDDSIFCIASILCEKERRERETRFCWVPRKIQQLG